MSTLDVTGSVRDTWECLNNQNSVDQLQQLWLTSSIEKYGLPVWRRSTGNRFMDPHHRPGDLGTRLDSWNRCRQKSPHGPMGMSLASMQQAMHLRPRSQLVGRYVRRSLYGQP